MSTEIEQLIIARLAQLEDKLDTVRTNDLPKLKTEMALLINDNKANSKLHSAIGGFMAVVISAVLSHFQTK